MKLKIDENGVIVLDAVSGIDVPVGTPIPVRLERFKLDDSGSIIEDPLFIGLTNDELDDKLLLINEELELETLRSETLQYATSKKATILIKGMRSVDGVVGVDNAGYLLVKGSDKRLYEKAVAGVGFDDASTVSGVPVADYRALVIADYEARKDKKAWLAELINAITVSIYSDIVSATTREELSAVRSKINILSEQKLEDISVANIAQLL